MLFTSLFEDQATQETVPATVNATPLYGCNCSCCVGLASDQLQAGSTPGATAPGSVSASSAVDGAQALISGSQWSGADASGKTVITYSFANTGSQFAAEAAAYSATLTAFSDADKAMTRTLLANIAAVANVTFVEVADNGPDGGQVRYAYSQAPNDMGYAGFAFFPSTPGTGGDVWIGKNQASSQWDYYRPDLVLHETLHAIGLKHSFSGSVTLDSQSDIIPNTVMSYSAMAGSQSGSLNKYPTEPMVLDVAALQAMYGAASHNAGNTVYALADASFQSGFRALWDSAGNDTFDASGIGHGVTLDLNQGGHSDIGAQVNANAYYGTGAARTMSTTVYTSTLTISAGAQIENAMGSAFGDVIVGNSLANYIAGGGGNDSIGGGAGDDYLVGGTGNDLIDGGVGFDTAAFSGSIANFKIERTAGGQLMVTDRLTGQGTDTITGVEKLRFDDLTVDLTVQDIGRAATDARLHSVVELYLGFFNRVPDAQGLGYWVQQLNDGMTTAKMADWFYSSALQYSSLTGYSSAMTNDQFVNVIYKNVLGRSTADAEGLAYWSKALTDGSQTRGSLLDSILNSAHTFEGDSQYGYVAALLDNKYEVGKLFAVDLGLTFNSAEQSIERGMQIAAAVTPTGIAEAVKLMGVTPHDLTLTF